MASLALLLAWLCACAPYTQPADAGDADLVLWHSFATNSREERIFLKAIDAFRDTNPELTVEVSYVRYLELVTQFITAAQGGEAPDVIRFSNDHLGEVGHVRVEGLQLLEDLRPHLTPEQRLRYHPRAMQAMRYQSALLAIPAIQTCLSLIYNRELFDARDIPYPRPDWTTRELLSSARAMTGGGTYGLAIPVKWAYWWMPFQTGFGGGLFDAQGEPTLDSKASADAVEFLLALEQEHAVVQPGMHPESMKTAFLQGKAGMVIDGPWNWGTYLDAGLDIGQELLPLVAETGLRMAPLLSFQGWAVSKDSHAKPSAVALALWLTSAPVQRELALETFNLPTLRRLSRDEALAEDPALAGFLRQTEHCALAPTTRASSLVFEPLDAALGLVHQGDIDALTALTAANDHMRSVMRE